MEENTKYLRNAHIIRQHTCKKKKQKIVLAAHCCGNMRKHNIIAPITSIESSASSI